MSLENNPDLLRSERDVKGFKKLLKDIWSALRGYEKENPRFDKKAAVDVLEDYQRILKKQVEKEEKE